MIKTILSDLAYVLIFPQNKSYHDELNALYQKVGSKNDFLFGEYFAINQSLFDYYNSLKSKYEIVMYTSGTLQNAKDVKHKVLETFSKVYSAAELGISKKDPNSYVFIAGKLKRNPSEILFIDDTLNNIEAAQKAGLETIRFQSNEALFREVKSRL